MSELAGPAKTTPAGPDSAAAVAKVAERFKSFVTANGGSGIAVVSYLGRRGARIVVVAQNGPFADAVVPDIDQAAAICAAAGLPLAGWDRELSSRVTVSAADRIRMAGTGR